MGEGHLPVLVDEVLASLAVGAGSSMADCTVGGGGHAERLLEATSPDGRLLGLDADRAAISETKRVLARFGDRVILRQANFESIYDDASEAGAYPSMPSSSTSASAATSSPIPTGDSASRPMRRRT